MNRFNIDWLNIEKRANALIVSPKDDLAAKYDWLKSSDRDGQMGVLSAVNRRTLVLSPGTYRLDAVLTLDTDYVDIVALAQSQGKPLASTDYEWVLTGGKYYPSAIPKPSGTLVVRSAAGPGAGTGTSWEKASSSISQNAVIVQSANDVRLNGFGVLNDWTVTAPNGLASYSGVGNRAYAGAAYCITATDNAPSVYTEMWFWCVGAGLWTTTSPGGWCRHSLVATTRFNGFWYRCITNGHGYRQENDAATCEPVILDCLSGTFSVGGDYSQSLVFDGTVKRFIASGHSEAVYEKTYLTSPKEGYGCIMGCRSYSGSIGTKAVIEDVQVGDNSLVMLNTIAGTLRRCKAGETSICGQNSPSDNYFTAILSSAVIEDCEASAVNSQQSCFAGGNISNGGIAGTLRRCKAISSGDGWNLLKGAKIENSEFISTAANADCLRIGSSDVSILRNTIRTNSGKAITNKIIIPLWSSRLQRLSGTVYGAVSSSNRSLFASSAADEKFMIGLTGGEDYVDTNSIEIVIQTPAVYAVGGSVEFYAIGNTDVPLTIISDGTNNGKGPFEKSGVIKFTTPSGIGWNYKARNSVRGAWIYAKITVAGDMTTIPQIADSPVVFYNDAVECEYGLNLLAGNVEGVTNTLDPAGNV